MLIPRRALARRAAGGKRAVGRDSISSTEYQALRHYLLARAQFRCECCRVQNVGLHIEHAMAASAGGADSENNCWITCLRCHRWKSAPYANGRLRVFPLGAQRFRWEEWKGPDKWTATLIRIIRDSSL